MNKLISDIPNLSFISLFYKFLRILVIIRKTNSLINYKNIFEDNRLKFKKKVVLKLSIVFIKSKYGCKEKMWEYFFNKQYECAQA